MYEVLMVLFTSGTFLLALIIKMINKK
ncbi:hypothetical protein [Halobacillus shinanisalinarum]